MMVIQIAFGIVLGFFLLAAILLVIFLISVFISKSHTFRTIDSYDDIWEEDNEDADEYIRKNKKTGR